MKVKMVKEVKRSDDLWRFACGDVFFPNVTLLLRASQPAATFCLKRCQVLHLNWVSSVVASRPATSFLPKRQFCKKKISTPHHLDPERENLHVIKIASRMLTIILFTAPSFNCLSSVLYIWLLSCAIPAWSVHAVCMEGGFTDYLLSKKDHKFVLSNLFKIQMHISDLDGLHIYNNLKTTSPVCFPF